MASEKSFVDRAQRTRNLGITVGGFSPGYAPVDSQFSLANLVERVTICEAANVAVSDAEGPWEEVVDERVALVKEIGTLVTQGTAFVKSNTVWKPKYEGIKSLADKVRGVRPPRPKPPTGEGAPPVVKARELGERSYAEIASFFRQWVKRVTALDGFAPPDVKIGTAALTVKQNRLEALNQLVPALEEDLDAAITARYESYFGPVGLKFRFDGVKTAVKGQYGVGSAQWGMVKSVQW